MDEIFHDVKKVVRLILFLVLFLCGAGAGWYAKAAQGTPYSYGDGAHSSLSTGVHGS